MKLERMEFEHFIWEQFVAFLNEEDNHMVHGNGIVLKPGKEFRLRDITSRTSQVDEILWREVLLTHLRNMYN